MLTYEYMWVSNMFKKLFHYIWQLLQTNGEINPTNQWTFPLKTAQLKKNKLKSNPGLKGEKYQ